MKACSRELRNGQLFLNYDRKSLFYCKTDRAHLTSCYSEHWSTGAYGALEHMGHMRRELSVGEERMCRVTTRERGGGCRGRGKRVGALPPIWL